MGSASVYFHVGRYGHPFFDEQMHSAPEGFLYGGSPELEAGGTRAPRRIALQGARLRKLRAGMERVAIRGLSWSGHVRRSRVEPPAGCVLIHSAQQLLREAALPYVVDFECVEAFSLYQRAALARPWARRKLFAALSDECCRWLLPWSEASRRGLEAALGASCAAALAPKTTTVLPAIRPRAAQPVARGSGALRVLFVGTAFEAKGGVEAVRAVVRARATHDVTLDLVSDVPPAWRREVEASDGVRVHAWPAPAERVASLFAGSHLLLFPSHMDTLGFVILEAMSQGMPVLSTRHFAVPELVHDDVSGLLVEGENLLYGEDGLCRFSHTLPPPSAFRQSLASPSEAYVERLAGALARVAEEGDLHKRLAVGAYASVTEGHLSVGRRREVLGRIYRDALAV